MTTDQGNPLYGLDTPPPPEDLRGQALAAAAAALGREPTADWWSRLWFCRPLRLAWTVTVLVAVAGHAWLYVAGDPAPHGAGPMVTDAQPNGDPELEEFVDLPRIDRELLVDAGSMVDRYGTGNRKEGL